MTIQEIKLYPSYAVLKRNGLTDENIVQFYTLPKGQRSAFLNTFKTAKVETKPQPQPSNRGTQMCTENPTFREVDAKFREYMSTNFIVNGKSYNPFKMGYTFKWNNNKTRFGVHKLRWRNTFLGTREYTKKSIELSRYMYDNAHKNLEDWIDTILHEIAHAIDYEIRGKSNHDRHWVRVAKAIGCSGERCGSYKVEQNYKWLGSCSCSSSWKRHKLTRSVRHGQCAKCHSSIDWKQQF